MMERRKHCGEWEPRGQLLRNMWIPGDEGWNYGITGKQSKERADNQYFKVAELPGLGHQFNVEAKGKNRVKLP